ncbi:MAG: hypothetical protein U0J29_06785 [Ruminococcus sp.]|nr:hypothetical protein [Ruminococcus sp.]
MVRPEDLDWQTALKYVENAMANLDTLKTIRYSAFSVGDYCICGGISCITKYLVEKLKKSDITFPSQIVSEYLRDCKGRSTACFIGFAISKSEVRSGKIPDIPLSKYWDVYLEYLKHQWDKSTTHSEELNFPPVTLDEKTYSSNYEPKFELIQGKKVVRNQKENLQGTLDYFFDQILNKGSQDSFISDIDRNEWDALKFTCASVSDDFYRALKSTPQTTATQEDSFGSIMGMRKSEKSAPVSNDDSEMKSYMHGQIKTSSTTYSNPNCQRPSHETGSKKNNANLVMGIVAAAVLVVVIVAIIALALGKNGAQATAFSLPVDEIEKVLKNNL